MLIEAVLNKAIRDYINSILGDGYAIKADQNAPRPLGPYCTVKTSNIIFDGMEQRVLTDEQIPNVDIVESISGMRNVTFSINYYRDSSYDNAHAVYISFARESTRDFFNERNIAFRSRSQILEISEVVGAAIEERAHFDLVINLVASDTDIIRSIQSLEIDGEFKTQKDSYNFTIEV